MKTLFAKYKKYFNGGQMDDETRRAMGLKQAGSSIMTTAADTVAPGMGQVVGAVSAMGAGIVDAIDAPDEYGQQSLLGAVAKGNFQGGTLGAIGAISEWKNNRTKVNFLKTQETQTKTKANEARLLSDPTARHGILNANYYAAYGGDVGATPAVGGSVKPLSSSASEFKGPSHEKGGIELPAMNAEVEGKETTNGSYVFSHRLGFAQLHKPIAKAMGKIEMKTLSPERVNSLKILKGKEQELKLSQEYAKQMLGINE